MRFWITADQICSVHDKADAESPIFNYFYTSGGNEAIEKMNNFTQLSLGSYTALFSLELLVIGM